LRQACGNVAAPLADLEAGIFDQTVILARQARSDTLYSCLSHAGRATFACCP
jgi:hypothetical protein